MLFDHQRTPLDLRFRLGPFPVTVNPFFWLTMALLGQWVFKRHGFDIGLLWIACGFVSILWHELGHAIAMRRYGSPAVIVLYGFGGVAIASYESPSPRRRLVIAAAGPIASLVLLGVVWGTNQLYPWAEQHSYLDRLYDFLFQINLLWTLLNLLPIWPLDGSKMLREVLVIRRLRQPDYRTQQVSFGLAVALGVIGVIRNFGPESLEAQMASVCPWWLLWVIPGPVMTLMMFFFAYQSYEMMRRYQRPRLYVDDRAPYER